MFINPILACDFYKIGHKDQYPEGTEVIYSNFTPRSDRLAAKTRFYPDGIVFGGLQGFIKWFLQVHFQYGFFKLPKQLVVGLYKKTVDKSLGIDCNADHIAALWDLQYLPLEIKALPEGSIVPMKVPVLTVRNTLPEFYWLTNYFETIMSAELWKFINNATIAFQYRVMFEYYARETGSPAEFSLWQGHDFSFRGMSGVCDAAASGAGHLFSFLGTDTIPAINYIEVYYGGEDTFVGGSVPASEHSVMCAGGKDDEIETFRRMLKQYPSGVVSIVSDTWDFWNVITNTAAVLKNEILSREKNAVGLCKTVFRPDSGDPVEVLCGAEYEEAYSLEDAEDIAKDMFSACQEHGEYGGDGTYLFKVADKFYEITVKPDWNRYDKQYYFIDGWYESEIKEITLTPAQKGAVECLWDIFGGNITNKGYKVLDEHVGLIYGDSITLERAEEILQRLQRKGFASCNVVFGIGSYTYQYSTRDSFGQAMKATWAQVNGEGRELFKDPVTDSGTKKSAKGLLRVEKNAAGEYYLLDQQTQAGEATGELQTVFINGALVKVDNIDSIRQRINDAVKKAISKIPSNA